jgi:hypothetical protein
MARKFRTYLFNYSLVFCLVFVSIVFLSFDVDRTFAEIPAGSTQVTLEWSPNDEPDLAGYRVFFREEGQSYNYADPSWEGTDTTCTIYNLDDTKTYYFAARAFDSAGLESGNSNEACLEPPAELNNEITIEAEDMPIKTTGGAKTDGWNIWSNGYIADNVNFAAKGIYTFEVTARGSFAGEAWPIMQVRVDQTVVGTVTVDSASWTVFIIAADVAIGTHEVAFAFTNDYYNSPEDRNLYIDKVTIRISETGENRGPTANAGPDQISDEGQLVILNGSNSTDPDDGIAGYHWVQTGGPQVTLSDPNGQQTTFTASDVGAEGATLIFELTVVDYSGIQDTDACVVNVTRLNEPPEADAGADQTVNEDVVVTLDGSSSLDIDNGITACEWTQIGGPSITLSDPASFQPTFTAPNTGPEGASLTFNLTVTDAGGLQDSDAVIVNISWQNEPPKAVVAEEYIEVAQGTLVTLDGSGSTDSDDGIASYVWSQVDGTPVTFSGSSAVATFTAPETGLNGSELKFKLTVTDNNGLQGSADVYVYITDMAQADSVTILRVRYSQWLKNLTVQARSDAPEGSVTLTAWANYGARKVELGDLVYFTRYKVYSKTFRRILTAPDTVTVTSSGGGSDTR